MDIPRCCTEHIEMFGFSQGEFWEGGSRRGRGLPFAVLRSRESFDQVGEVAENTGEAHRGTGQ